MFLKRFKNVKRLAFIYGLLLVFIQSSSVFASNSTGYGRLLPRRERSGLRARLLFPGSHLRSGKSAWG